MHLPLQRTWLPPILVFLKYASGRRTKISPNACAKIGSCRSIARREDRDANGVRKKFGVSPILIPDFLALVGDSADGYPGISGIGKIGAAQLLNQYGPIEDFPEKVLVGTT